MVAGLVTIAATAAADAWLGVRTGVFRPIIVTGNDGRDCVTTGVTVITAGGPRVPARIGGEAERIAIPETSLGFGP